MNEFAGKIFGFFKKHWFYIVLLIIFTVGISYRLEAYIFGDWLGFDEAQLACNFLNHKGFLWVFRPLDNIQVAPPIFLLGTKVLTLFFGSGEYTLKFIPFLASVLSVFVFYFLSKKFLKSPAAIIIANSLFATNFIIVNYAAVFKQYSLDVLVFMAVLLWVSNLKSNNFTLKKCAVYGILFTIFFFVSQPVVFILFGFVLYNFKRIKDFKFWLIPLIPLSFVLLYKFSMPKDLNVYMDDYWQLGFVAFGHITDLIRENIIFFLIGGKHLLPFVPLVFIGALISVFRAFRVQNELFKINCILLLSLFGAILASALRLYPLLGRTIVYLFPFFIIFITRCFDLILLKIRFKKSLSIVLISLCILFILLFQAKVLCKNKLDIFLYLAKPKDLSILLKENFNNKRDVLILPSLCNTLYEYYSNLLDINIDKNQIIEINSYDKEKFVSGLNNLKKGREYWIFLCVDTFAEATNPYIQEWIRKNGVSVIKEIKTAKCSYLYKIKL